MPPQLGGTGGQRPRPQPTLPGRQSGMYWDPVANQYRVPGGAPSPAPTFQSPRIARTGIDPRIENLTAGLARPIERDPDVSNLLAELRANANLANPEIASLRAEQAREHESALALRQRLEGLGRGEGINVGTIAEDPEAVAFRVAQERDLQRARESEADRLAASGTTGGGDFESRLAQLREASGEEIAGFEGALGGRRRTEAIQAAVSGANLEAQQRAARQTDLQRLMETLLEQDANNRALRLQATLNRGGEGRAGQLALLQTLLGEQTRRANLELGATSRGFEEELLRQQTERGRREEYLEPRNEEERRELEAGGFRVRPRRQPTSSFGRSV